MGGSTAWLVAVAAVFIQAGLKFFYFNVKGVYLVGQKLHLGFEDNDGLAHGSNQIEDFVRVGGA